MKTLLLSMAMMSAAWADEVVLRNGASFTGVVREEGERVVLEMDYGTMTFKKIDVRSISRGGDALAEFNEKLKTATDVKGMLALAAWAREKGLGRRAEDLYRKVLVLDSDQPEARKALGYEKVNGQWLTGDELMTARGFVKVDGRWMMAEDAAQIRRLEAEARIENDRAELAARMARMRHEEEMAKIALERERLDRRSDRWRWGSGSDWSWGPSPCGGFVGILLPPAGPFGTVPPTPPTIIPLGPPSPAGPSRR